MKIKRIGMVSFFLLILIGFTGCSSIRPITQSIINDVGGSSEIEKFQYYVSSRLVLNDAKKIRDQQNITKYGAAAITDIFYKNRIIINKNTMGVVLNSFRDEKGNLTLEICFEEDDNRRIAFKQDGAGSDRKFYIVYQDAPGGIIDYGGELYTVEYSGDRPYLKVKIYKQLKQKTKTKWASGRRVRN
ncbi:MAG: hypothetical protein LBC53_09800 [Spirochaetaceae bacterium]|jgi:hypothetical protein|nr:hypothetical protein [Spirochaetaceae bacterium]